MRATSKRKSYGLLLPSLSQLQSQPFLVECPPVVFCTAWLIILFLHLAHAAALFMGAYAQIRSIRSPDEVDANFRAVGMRFHSQYYYISIAIEVVFTAYHFYSIANLVRFSIRARELSLVAADSDPHSRHSSRLMASCWLKVSSWFEKRFSRIAARLSRSKHLYGIRGPLFERGFHLKEVYETFWECLQLYENLYHAVHPPAGFLALFVVVLNCWSTPLIYWRFPHSNHRATRLVLCLAVDAVLDFISSVALPYTVYVHYRALLAHPQSYDAAWTFLAGTDLLQFAPNGFRSILSRLFPTTSMVANLMAIKPVLKRRQPFPCQPLPQLPSSSLSAVAPLTAIGSARTTSSATADVAATAATEMAAIVPPPPPPSLTTTVGVSRPRHPRWISALHAVLFTVGLTWILLLALGRRHARAEGVPHCRVVMRHWITPRVPCAVLEINCTADQLTGAETAKLLVLLRKVNYRAVRALTFCDCASLVVPREIQKLPHLNWLEFRNSTVVQWPRTAALTQTTTPRFSRLVFRRTNFSGFPSALYNVPQFPTTLLDITFSETNLSDVPATLHTTWPQPMATVVFEKGEFTRIPYTLLEMHTDVLSLAGNAITEVPPALLERKTFTLLSLAQNPRLEELPEQLHRGKLTLRVSLAETKAHGIWLVGTNVSSLPHWLWTPPATACAPSLSASKPAVFAEASPLCNAIVATATTTTTHTESECNGSTSPSVLRCDASTAPAFGISHAGFLVDEY